MKPHIQYLAGTELIKQEERIHERK